MKTVYTIILTALLIGSLAACTGKDQQTGQQSAAPAPATQSAPAPAPTTKPAPPPTTQGTTPNANQQVTPPL